MVKGLDKFEEYFRDFSDNYILIGGAACDILIENEGLNFRATKDLDIILVVEALSPEFVINFWKFIREGNYENKEKSTGEKKYYRFTSPDTEGFPHQLELFSRNPDIELEGDTHLTPIPVEEDVSSLSAILLDDDYYNFTLDNSDLIDGIHLASTCALICLKAKAYLDLKQRKEEGDKVDSDDIKKHRIDVVRLATILKDEDIDDLPKTIAEDLQSVIADIRSDEPNGRAIGKSLGTGSLDIESGMEQLEKTFRL